MPGPKILIKTGKRCTVTSGKDQSAIRKHAFAIDDVSDDFFYRPFAGGISVVALLLIDAAQQIQCRFELLLKKLENVGTGNFTDIGDLILGQF